MKQRNPPLQSEQKQNFPNFDFYSCTNLRAQRSNFAPTVDKFNCSVALLVKVENNNHSFSAFSITGAWATVAEL